MREVTEMVRIGVVTTTKIVVYHDLTLLFSVAFENTCIAFGFLSPSCIMVKVQ